MVSTKHADDWSYFDWYIYDIVLIVVFFHRHLQTGATQLYTYIITNVYLLSRWHF